MAHTPGMWYNNVNCLRKFNTVFLFYDDRNVIETETFPAPVSCKGQLFVVTGNA